MASLCSFYTKGNGQSTLYSHMEYAVSTSCTNSIDNKKAGLESYFIQLEMLEIDQDMIAKGVSNFELDIQGGQSVQFFVASDDIPYTKVFGPFNYVGDGQQIINVSLRSLDIDLIDHIELSQVLCGLTTNNGLNRPGFICKDDDQVVFAQAAPVIAKEENIIDDQNVYILTDESAEILAHNFTGLFDQPNQELGYQIHYYSVASHELGSFINDIIIGNDIMNIQESSCYRSCGMYEVSVRCENFDLALEKDVIGGPIFSIGDTVTYTISIINQGLVTGYDVVVKDLIPDGLAYIDALNPEWDVNAHSLPIDSIQAGQTHTIPIRLILEPTVSTMEIENIAEIIFAAADFDDDTPAFDEDSTPNNEDEKEDDIDDVTITVLENLCETVFSFSTETNKPLCVGDPIELEAIVESIHMPVSYSWKLNGVEISTDKEINITNPDASDFGVYQITVSDGMGCDGQMEFDVQPVIEQNINCISSINLTVGSDCSLGLIPEMLVLNNVSGINDYILEITDINGQVVNVDNVSGNDLSEPLTVKLIHPCTFQTVCWANVSAQYKLDPVFDFYGDTIMISCFDADQSNSMSDISEVSSEILDEYSFDSLLRENLCLQEWETISTDIILDPLSCGDGLIGRVYSIQFRERTIALDTALIRIIPVNIDSIRWPNDVPNVSCSAETSPEALVSFPFHVANTDTTLLSSIGNDGSIEAATCKLRISYSDQSDDGFCAFGTQKILREWAVVNWCTDQVELHTQHIFVVDKESPQIILNRDSIELALNGPICIGDIDLSASVIIRDNCDPNPTVLIGDYGSDGLFIQGISAGFHDLEVTVIDACGNIAIDTIYVSITESTPPVPVILSDISMTYTETSSSWVYAHMFDSNSADACGPVTIEIARASEVQQIRSNGDLAVWELRDRCSEGLETQDSDGDGEITVDEIFRERIMFCCTDVGQRIKIAVRVIDQFGNYTDIDAWIDIVSKDEPIVCDDGDPCTIGDREQDGCPCRGDVDVSDLDQDGIPDCIDQDFIVCIDDVTTSIERNELELYLDNGATPGPCEEAALADIGGEVRTYWGDMIEDVILSKNISEQTATDQDGLYAFKSNKMYVSYELEAQKNDDPLNGISALDIVLIQQYLLGLREFEDEAFLLAADINDDGRVTAVDIVQLRQLLLGQTTQFSNNNSWIFTPADPGIDPDNPFDYHRNILIQSLDEHQMKEDWIGIKVGDVSGDAIGNSNKANGRSALQMVINLPQMELTQGEEAIIPFYFNKSQPTKAIQLSFADHKGYSIKGLITGALKLTNEQYHILDGGQGVNIVWTDESEPTIDDETLFSLIIEPNKTTTTEDAIDINTGGLADLLYDHNDGVYQLELLAVDQGQTELMDMMYQNEPNPFIDYTIIPFEINTQKEVALRFYDGRGNVLLEKIEVYPSGRHEITISRLELNANAGPIYYEMKTEQTRLVRKMILAGR